MVAVLRAETFYLPPPSLPPDAWDTVAPAERALRWHEVYNQRRLPDIAREQAAEPVYARIDAGRWVAECGCQSAEVVSPDDPQMLCTLCLDGWHPVVFPEDVAAAEAEVEDQPRRKQFWYHPDDVAHQAERLMQLAERADSIESAQNGGE